MSEPIRIGAVLYEPKVSVIWNMIREYFEERNCPMDVVHYNNYELQVDALEEGYLDMAWNSPLAWVDTKQRLDGGCHPVAMRDTDRDLNSYFVVPADSDIESIDDLEGRSMAVGAEDSPQATLIPFGYLMDHGIEPYEDVDVTRFDVLVGKHGDHVGGERDAFEALEAGEVDASTMLELNWDSWVDDGTIDPDQYRILDETPTFDHCNFTVRDGFPEGLEEEWREVLFSMDWDDPEDREILEMEGLEREWVPGRTTKYDALEEAVEQLDYFEGRD